MTAPACADRAVLVPTSGPAAEFTIAFSCPDCGQPMVGAGGSAVRCVCGAVFVAGSPIRNA